VENNLAFSLSFAKRIVLVFAKKNSTFLKKRGHNISRAERRKAISAR